MGLDYLLFQAMADAISFEFHAMELDYLIF
jgi:hypothetical protein